MFRLPVLFLLIISLLYLIPLSGFGEKSKSYTYIGSTVCRECHGHDKIGNQYKIWKQSPHSKAYTSLTGEKSAAIAIRENISSPGKNPRCLKCHSTGKGINTAILEEGVGCEACHGPGSEYHKASNHVDFSSRENGYHRGIQSGMYPILGITSLKTREKLCLSCHNKNRPCVPENPPADYDDRIPLQVVDSLWKGNVNFRHPLRR